MKHMCNHCQHETFGVQCPMCGRFFTEDPNIAYLATVDPPIPEKPLRWGTVLGAWGDSFAAIGRIRQILKAQGLPGCSVVYYGEDAAIPVFLRAQPWIAGFLPVLAPSRAVYRQRNDVACSGRSRLEEWLPQAAREARGGPVMLPPLEEIEATHTTGMWMRLYRPQIMPDASLPQPPRNTAAMILEGLKPKPGQKVIMLHPSSTQSSRAEWHWPHWREAAGWLLEHTPHLYLHTGIEDTLQIRHPRLANLCGSLPDNMVCLALLDLCDGLVGTNNNLSLWTVTRNKPGLIMATRSMANLVDYYRRYIQRPPNTFCPCGMEFSEWERVARQWVCTL